jgi:peptidyl-prolyl cis-trans isomerase A (cyclophilin A)
VKVRSWLFALVLIGLASPSASAGQDPPPPPPTTNELVGTVTDAEGAPLQGVTVAAQNIRSGDPVVTTTAADGTYRLTLPLGIYRATFSKDAFTTALRAGIVIVPSAATTMDVQLSAVAGRAQGAASTGASGSAASDLRAGEVLVRISTPLGAIDVAVDTEHAPITAGNFLKYVDAGLYDGGRFYRVTRADNYEAQPPNRPAMTLIQGGIDPSKNAQRLPPIPLERTSVTGLKHVAGTVSMARGGPDTATSEFFILLDDQPSLDFGGKRFDDEQGAAAFGRVVSGLDVVRRINQQNPLQERNRQYLQTPVTITTVGRVGR